MIIRRAKSEDLPLMFEGAREFYASSRALYDFHLERFVAAWEQLFRTGDGVIFVAEVDGQIEGAIGGFAYQRLYGYERVMDEFFWFVKKSARGMGLKLYFKFRNWAVEEKQVTEIQMVELLDSMGGKVGDFYIRQGYIPIEKRYLLRIEA